MVIEKSFRPFDDSLLDRHPELKEVLTPSDQYPEIINILKNRSINLPFGTLITKIIINDGQVVERVYETPKGEIISLFSNSSKKEFDQAA